MKRKPNQGIKTGGTSKKFTKKIPPDYRLTEKQLNISEIKFRRLFETAQDGILFLDVNTGVITEVNPFLLKLIGYTHDEIIGKKLWEISPFRDIKANKESFKELQKKKYNRYENLPLQTKSGDIRYVEFISNIYRVGEKKVIQCNIRDITDRKIIADALQENETRFRELFNRMSSCVAVYEAVENGKDFIIKDFNASAERVEKTPRQKVLGRKVTEVFPGIREMNLLTTFRQVWKTGKAQSHPISIYKDNHIFGWRENFVYKLPSGEIVAMYEDLTERKQIEEKMTWLASFPEINPLFVLEVDPKIHVLYANHSVKKEFPEIETADAHHPLLKRLPEIIRQLLQEKNKSITIEIEAGGKLYSEIICTISNNPNYRVYANDITDLKKTELERKKSEEKYQRIVETAQEAIWVTDQEMKITFVNQHMTKLLGYSTEELIGHSVTDFYFRKDLPDLKHRMKSRLKGIAETFDRRLRHKDGSVIWTSVSASPLINAQGNMEGTFAMFTDISERRKTEIALKESEAHYRGLFENSPISLWEEDFSAVKKRLDDLKKQGISNIRSYLKSHPKEVAHCISLIKVLDVNKATLKLFHAKKKADLLKPLSDILSPSTLHEFREELNFIAEGRTSFKWETKNQTVTGETIDVSLSWSVAPSHESDLSKVFISLIDITQRHQVEIAMRESEIRYRTLFEDSPISLWEEDHSEVKKYLDKLKLKGITNFRDYFNKHPQEVKKCLNLIKILNINSAALRLYNANDKSEIMNNLSAVFSESSLTDYAEQMAQFAEGKKTIDQETEAQKLNGEKMTHLVRLQVAPGFEDSHSRVIVSVIDITDRKRAEEKQKVLADEEHKQRIFSEALTKNAFSLNSTLKTEGLLDAIIDNIQNVIPFEAVSIILIEGGHGRIARSEGFVEKGLSAYVDQTRFDFSKYKSFQKVIDSGSYVLIPDTRADPIWIQDDETAWKILSCLQTPIKEDDKVIGFLTLNSSIPNFYNEEHAKQLMVFTDQVSNAMKNARLFESTQRRMKRMNAMTLIDQAINSSLDINVSLEMVLIQTLEQLGADASDILMVNYVSNTLTFAKAKGFRTNAITKSNLGLGAGLSGQAVLERKVISIPDLRSAPESYFRNLLIDKEGFISYYCVPLITKGLLKGVMEVYFRKTYEADLEWVEFMEMLAQQTAIAINNAEMLNSLQVSNNDLKNAYDATLQGWVEALDLRDKENEGHSLRVTDITLQLAKLMNMEDKEMTKIKVGALLHDIGKISISDSILNKPGPLSEEEWKIMRKHPEYAFQILSKTKYLRDALDIPYCHHEKWDGSGYPRGLKGEAIPKAARVFAVVDVWDTLISNRLYRPAWSQEKALEYIQEQSGSHFDPQVVNVFVNNLKSLNLN